LYYPVYKVRNTRSLLHLFVLEELSLQVVNQRSLASERRARTIAVILSLGEIMPSCSRCAEKKLVCIAIAAPSGRQPSSCVECTKSNMRSSCNVRSVSDAEWSRVVASAAKLESELVAAREELRRSSEETAAAQEAQRVALEAQKRAFESQQSAFARLSRLEKVREKVRSKEYRLVEQGLRELEADEKKESEVEIAHTAAVGSFDTLDPRSLPLSGSFDFDLSFSMLPDVISDNTPVPFP